MNAHSLQVLGFHELLTLIAGYAQSSLGAGIVCNLRPSSDLTDIRKNRGLYEDMLSLAESSSMLPPLHIPEMTELLARVLPTDSVLAGEELLVIRAALEIVKEIMVFFREADNQRFENLRELAAGLEECREIRDSLWRSLDADGTVLDSASPELREVRRDIASVERRLQKMLDDMARNSDLRDALQDQFVTQRNGRYVLPVKRDARGALPGLVHDMSGSGQTLFVEPAAAVPMGNEMAQLKARERDEVRRILRTLSALVRAKADNLLEDQHIIAQMDAAAAVARWAVDYQCMLPAFGGMLVIKDARHPLLVSHFRKEGRGRDVVPLNLELPRGSHTLAITGSNTGGKTVALKTVGLLVLCAQSGLPVSAGADSLFPVFDHLMADIGDEQSMEANLSTFSAHVSAIAAILKQAAKGRSLVLLDELGSGTDPVEGGALACGILDALSKMDTLVIATTHLGLVKNYVHSRKDMTNAAVRFNVETLQPEYVLDIGRPGASHAMLIAKKIGMPESVMRTAEGMMSGTQLKLEDMLAKLEGEQRRIAAMRREVETLKGELEKKNEQLARQNDELRRERRTLMNEAYQRAEGIVENTRRDMENMVRRIRENAKTQSQETPDGLNGAVAEAREQLKDRERRIETGKAQTAAKLPPPIPEAQLVPGKKIWVEKLNAHGRIASVAQNGKTAVVEVNGISFTMKTKELSKATEPDVPVVRKRGEGGGVAMPRVQGNTSHEINCIGLTVEEAIDRLQPFLSNCVLAGLDEVRIVHGFGTGRLKQGIHTWLRTQKYVKSFLQGKDFEDAGGGGVTIVRLNLG